MLNASILNQKLLCYEQDLEDTIVKNIGSMDDSGLQTCLQHENMLCSFFQYKIIGTEHMFTILYNFWWDVNQP